MSENYLGNKVMSFLERIIRHIIGNTILQFTNPLKFLEHLFILKIKTYHTTERISSADIGKYF